ncbi:tetratricopeptide repeat protein [Viscerimonas tarda]
MKKILLIVGITVGIQFAYAQQPVKDELPDRYFNEGKELFFEKNYTGAIHSLSEFLKRSTNPQLAVEADYMIVSSLFFNGNKEAEIGMKDFLDAHPETYHRNQLCFYIGSCHFDKKEWQKALYWFNQSDIDYLSASDQEDYSFRYAYSSLQKGDRGKAKQQFGLLTRNSRKYTEPATYYLAYIDFGEGNYDKSIAVFEKFRNKPAYKEEATFFITQGYFIQNELDKTVSEGESYLRLYPDSKNTKEIYRLLGNSYNRLYNTNQSIQNYEKYLSLEDKPLREDMYLLGTSYYQTGKYQQAVDALKKAASADDKLGQVANMQLGQAYLKLKDNNSALMAFEAASRAKFDPETGEAALYNYALLVHQTALSVFDQSVTVFQRFLKEYPQSKYANQVNEILASTLLSTKNNTAALNAINEIKSPGRQILQAKQIIYFRLGTENFVNNNYVVAEQNFNACIGMGDYDPKVRNESYFWKGEIAYRNNNYQVAANDYQTYLSNATPSDVNYALAYYNLAYSYFQTKQYANSLPNFQRYVSLERDRSKPNYPDALNRIGDCYLYNRNFSEAEKYYAQAVSANPSASDYAEFQKAFVLGLQRNYTGKIAALDNLMRKYPDSSYYDDALFEKSRALVMLSRDKDAINVLEKLVHENPQSPLNPQAGVQLGQLYFNTNNHQKSIEAYKRVIGAYPNSEEARISVKSLESVYKDMNDINSYASYVNSLGMGTIVSSARQDSLSYLAAENVYMKGQKSNAKAAMSNYLKSNPKGIFWSDAHYFLGYMAFEDKDMDTALNEFSEVVKSNNRKYLDDALIYISGIQFDKKNYEEAYAAYEKLDNATTIANNKNTAQLGMLRTASQLNKDKEVIDAASALLKSEKTSPDIITEATYFRAKSLMNTKQTDAAVKDYQSLAADTRNVFGAEAQYLLAETYFKWKSYDKAIKQVQDFMKQGTPHQYWMAKALVVLSDCYAAEGDSFKAKQYIESLKANYKGYEQDIQDAINERIK